MDTSCNFVGLMLECKLFTYTSFFLFACDGVLKLVNFLFAYIVVFASYSIMKRIIHGNVA